jgi:hypothetical protein
MDDQDKINEDAEILDKNISDVISDAVNDGAGEEGMRPARLN